MRRAGSAVVIALSAIGHFLACGDDDKTSPPPIAGGTLLAVADGLGGIATDGTHVYFGDHPTLYRLPATGGMPTPLTPPHNGRYAAEDDITVIAAGRRDATGTVPLAWASFWTLAMTRDSMVPARRQRRWAENLVAAEDGSFMWCEPGSGYSTDAGVDGASVLPAEVGRAFRSTVDGEPTRVAGCAAPGVELAPAFASVAPTTVADPTPGLFTLLATTDATTVYFSPKRSGQRDAASCDGLWVFALDKPTGAVRTLSATGCNSVVAMAVDDRHIYVVSTTAFMTPEMESRIYRLPKNGGTPEVVQAPKPYRVTALAVDANALYWTGDYSREGRIPAEVGVLVRVPKR